MTQRNFNKVIICSDLHIYDWPEHNKELRRTKAILSWFKDLVVNASKSGSRVLFCGDLFHDSHKMSIGLWEVVHEYFKSINRLAKPGTVIGITGNHDRDGDSWDNSPSWVKIMAMEFPFINCIDMRVWEVPEANMVVAGIPYIKGNVGLGDIANRLLNNANSLSPDTTKILLLHTDLPGAVDTNGMELRTYENIPQKVGKFFKGWDWVFSGHIHQPMEIRDNIIMVGSPMHTRVIDMGSKMGHWEFQNGKLVLVKANLPEYRYEGEEGNEGDVYIKRREHKVEKKDTKKQRKLNLSNWDKVIDEYAGKSAKGRVTTAKRIINSVNE